MQKEKVLKYIKEMSYMDFVLLLTIIKNLEIFIDVMYSFGKERVIENEDFTLKAYKHYVIITPKKFQIPINPHDRAYYEDEITELVNLAVFIVANKITTKELNVTKLLALKMQEEEQEELALGFLAEEKWQQWLNENCPF